MFRLTNESQKPPTGTKAVRVPRTTQVPLGSRAATPCLHPARTSQFPRQRRSPPMDAEGRQQGSHNIFTSVRNFPLFKKRIANVRLWKRLKHTKCLPMALFWLIADGWRHALLRHV